MQLCRIPVPFVSIFALAILVCMLPQCSFVPSYLHVHVLVLYLSASS